MEYLVKPLEIFTEVARVLKPGGSFVVTFSDRWFPTKVISLWQEMHAFERMGLVLDLFDKSQAFANLGRDRQMTNTPLNWQSRILSMLCGEPADKWLAGLCKRLSYLFMGSG